MQALTLGAMAGGAALSYYGTTQEGKEANKLGKVQQQQLNAEAEAAKQAGIYESREKRKEAQRTAAAQIAQMSANGGLLTGSNLTILADSAREYEADALMIKRNYNLEATRLRNQGSIARWQGQVARRNSRIRAVVGALSTAGNVGMLYGLGKGSTGKLTPTGKATLVKY